VHIAGVRPGMNVDVTPRVEYTKIDLSDSGLSGKQTSVLELFVKVTESVQIELVTDINIPDHDLCPPDASYIIYVVQPGDSLFKIAKRFGVSLNDVINANKATIPDPNLIYPGQKVIIPCVPKPKG
jgi:LysM repeat protein